MFLRLTCICLLLSVVAEVNSTFFDLQTDNPNESIIGNMLRAKAQMWDNFKNSLTQKVNVGARAASTQWSDFQNSVGASLDATGKLIDSGIAAGKQYGRTIFKAAIIVPKTLHELAAACFHANSYIKTEVAQNLSYVDSPAEYLFQFVTEEGSIIPITADVASQLVPGLVV